MNNPAHEEQELGAEVPKELLQEYNDAVDKQRAAEKQVRDALPDGAAQKILNGLYTVAGFDREFKSMEKFAYFLGNDDQKKESRKRIFDIIFDGLQKIFRDYNLEEIRDKIEALFIAEIKKREILQKQKWKVKNS